MVNCCTLQFLKEESEISIQKDFGQVLGNGFWQILFISVAVQTRKSQKVKK